MTYTDLLRQMDVDRFATVLAASSRRVREAHFARHGVRQLATTGRAKLGAGHKTQERTQRLHAVLQQREDEALAEEVVRLYLLTQRPLLALALDKLGIEHEDGLTESDDVLRLGRLSDTERQGIIQDAVAKQVASEADATMYLSYMALTATREDEAKKAG